jgi:hypothetical protein
MQGDPPAPPNGVTLPSVATPPSPTLLSYLAPYAPHISDLTLALREMILDEAPEAVESLVNGYAVAIGFSFTGKPLKDGFCHIATYSTHVNLGFNRGALLPDPNRVLKGDGKTIRHLTMRNAQDLESPFLKRYLQTAIEQATRPESRPGGKRRKSATPGARLSRQARGSR